MRRRILLLLALLVLALAVAAVTAIAVIRREVRRTVVLPAEVVIEVSPGENLRKIAARLRQAGLIQSERVFLWRAFREGADHRIKFGRHQFEGTVSLDSVLRELGHSPKPILRVTIPEGLTLREIGALLDAAGAVPAAGYDEVACSEEFRRLVEAPATASCGEGYLFPDTYDLVPGTSPGEIVDLQVRRFREVVGPLLAEPAPGTPPPVVFPGTPAERAGALLTLASIVEKETAQPGERPRIAAVFYNRLKMGMPLQTDPTVIYGVIDSGLPWDGNLTRAHLLTLTPYNTYMRRGLPPGPICNPGLASVEAVLRPATTEDLYFVARGDGSHEFSRNLADHNRAVRRYQLR